jgi:hypothetical protein
MHQSGGDFAFNLRHISVLYECQNWQMNAKVFSVGGQFIWPHQEVRSRIRSQRDHSPTECRQTSCLPTVIMEVRSSF